MTDPAAREREQDLIDAEVRASRRAVLAAFRQRLHTNPETLSTENFLTLADWKTVRTAVVIAAGGTADSSALHTRDPRSGKVRLTRYRGLSYQVVAEVTAVAPSGGPMAIDDLTVSPALAGQPSLQALLAAGFRSVHWYPLRNNYRVPLGTLSLYYRRPGPHDRQGRLAWAAAYALAHAPSPPSQPEPRSPPSDAACNAPTT